MLDVSSEDITDGPLLRALLVLAAPLFVQNIVQVGQQIVDLFWLGRLSGEAVAAIGLVFPLMTLLYAAVIMAPFVGTQVLVSQRVGADDRTAARRATFTGIVLGVGLAVLFGGLAVVLADPLTRLMTATRPRAVAGPVPGMAANYLTVVALGLPLTILGEALEGAYVGWGDSRATLYMNVVAVGLNVVLDPAFIFGVPALGVPGFGIEGAALATVVSYTAGTLLGFAMVARGRNGGMLSRATATLRLDEARELLDVGLPSGGQRAAQQSARLVVVVVAFAAGGAVGLAAYSVGVFVAAVAVVPAIGLQQAAQSVVGQNLGGGRPGRAGRATWLGTGVAAAGLALVGAVQFLVPGLLTDLFVPDLDAATRGLAVDYLRILALGYPAIGAAYLVQAGFNGARRTRTSFLSSILQYWGVRVPIATVGGTLLAFGIHAVFWAVTVSNVVAALGLAVYFRHEVAGGMLDRAAEAVGTAGGDGPPEAAAADAAAE